MELSREGIPWPMLSAGAEAPRRGARPALPSQCQPLPLDRNSARRAVVTRRLSPHLSQADPNGAGTPVFVGA